MSDAPPAVGASRATWYTEDVDVLALFLSTPTGGRMLACLNRTKPDLERYQNESAKYLLGRAAQFERMLGELVFLASPESAEDRKDLTHTPAAGAPAAPMYPDLDDDSAWEPSVLPKTTS